jgi:alpha-tubulin suppressor-like RCC1 family protein
MSGSTRTVPTQVTSIGSWVVAVSAAMFHSHVVTSAGTVLSFGDNSSGVYGDGNTTPSSGSTPVTATGLTNVVQVAAGNQHVLALRSDGSVWAWGENSDGQLGIGSTTDSLVPVPTGLSGIVKIAAGSFHSMALDGLGQVFVWGDDSSGQIGDGGVTNIDVTSPVLVTTAVDIAAGYTHSLAVTSGGTVKVWGANGTGQLGDGTLMQQKAPISLGLTNIVAVGGATHSSFAMKSDGSLYGWGDNDFGQLGNGLTLDSKVPYKLAAAGTDWLVATPKFSVPGGAYSTPLTVVITSATSGATVTYTTTGVDPTIFDAVVPGGGVTVNTSQTLKARAFKAGMPDSEIFSATYTFP